MSRPHPSQQRAFTLVELLIAIVVLGVLMTLAAPSFRDFILMQRLKGIHAQIVTDMQFARSEAASRGALVSVRVQTAADMSCYVLLTDKSLPNKASGRCDCTKPEGSRCDDQQASDIRTVLVQHSRGVTISLPAGQAGRVFAFDPVNGGIVVVRNEGDSGPPDTITILSFVDVKRSLAAVIGPSGRPTVCSPPDSTMSQPAC